MSPAAHKALKPGDLVDGFPEVGCLSSGVLHFQELALVLGLGAVDTYHSCPFAAVYSLALQSRKGRASQERR